MLNYFDPNKVFGLTDNAFPDTSHFGGGVMFGVIESRVCLAKFFVLLFKG